jgi:aminoglycoside phosphotransferase (APT) family kinase protein
MVITSPEEQRLAAFIEECVGGKVVSLDRQPRWRKCWYATVEREGKALPLYIRGDKQLDAEPYPGLKREHDILVRLARGGLPVPRVYGYCQDPEGIVMDRMAGERDMALLAGDEDRRRVALHYVEIMARMHALDIDPFVEMGIRLPPTPADTYLAYLDANQPLYERTKRAPEPLIEFGLKWLRRNVPERAPRSALIHGDAGQFLCHDGKLIGIYDFEAAHIGDPLADLAALRVRDPTEPLGIPVSEMIRHYQKITGEPVDAPALSFHTASFMMTAVMSLAGPLKDPSTPLHGEYLVWDLTCRRAFIWAMAECMGVTVERCTPPAARPTRQARTVDVLAQTLERMVPGGDADRAARDSALMMCGWLAQNDSLGHTLREQELQRAADFLGTVPADLDDLDRRMETYVLEAGPEQDQRLLEFFAWQIESQVMIAANLDERLEGYALKAVDLAG